MSVAKQSDGWYRITEFTLHTVVISKRDLGLLRKVAPVYSADGPLPVPSTP